MSDESLLEYKRVLGELGVRRSLIGKIINLLREEAELVSASALPNIFPDPGDDPFCGCAETGRADFIPFLGADTHLTRDAFSGCGAIKSGQRCGFTLAMGCGGRGICVTERTGNCFDPGGRCGCDGEQVDLFCAQGSSTEFASAPVGFVGLCPRPCTQDDGCPNFLVCRKGVCAQRQKPK